MNFLTVDFSDLTRGSFFSFAEFREAQDKVQQALNLLNSWKSAGRIGFIDLPLQKNIASDILKKNKKYQKKFKTLVQCGIGGSSLGAQALVSALSEESRVYFIDNVDPLSIRKIQDKIDFSKTVFHIVSKSGGTIEIMYQYQWIVAELKKRKLELNEHIIVSTEDNNMLI